jgi:hypothetical protein
MNDHHPTHPSADPAPSSQGSGDPAADPIGWTLRMLEHLVDVGMGMVDSRLRQELLVEQALRQQVEAGQVAARPASPERAPDDEAPDQDVPEPAGKQPRGEVGLTFQRLSRGIRLCLALHSQIRQDRQERDAKMAAERARRATLAHVEQRRGQKTRVKRAVERAIDAERKQGTREGLLRDWRRRLDERLRDEEIERDLLNLPINEILKRICSDLGLDPDWDLWKHEAWAMAEAEAELPGSPYAKPPQSAEAVPAETKTSGPTTAAPRPQPATTGSDPP